jgi:hypothetical protein
MILEILVKAAGKDLGGNLVLRHSVELKIV